MAAAAVRSPLPTGNGLGGGSLDFLDRLSLAEARDSHRQQQHQPRLPQQQPWGVAPPMQQTPQPMPQFQQQLQFGSWSEPRKRDGIRFHPNVVTRVEAAVEGLDRSCVPRGEYETAQEEQAAINRMITKMQLKEATGRADGASRAKLNAIAADEAWRRADAVLAEVRPDSAFADPSPAAIRERQKQAALRCQRQMTPSGGGAEQETVAPSRRPSSPGPMHMMRSPPLTQPKPAQHRAPSPRPTPPLAVPGHAVRRDGSAPPDGLSMQPSHVHQARAGSPHAASPMRHHPYSNSPRRGAAGMPGRGPSPRPSQRRPSPRPGTAVRASTRVIAPPGGASSVVFG